MDTTQLYPLVMKAVDRAIAKDAAGASDALVEIGTTGDEYDVYAACCGFAEIGKAALRKFYGDKAPNPEHGGMWAMQILDPANAKAAELFASRFLIAYCNDDKDTAPALFRAALESDEYVESVSALLANVAGLTRLVTAKSP